MSLFGYSYPAGCSGPPEEDYVEPWEILPRCTHCGAWLPLEPQLSGGHDFERIDYVENGFELQPDGTYDRAYREITVKDTDWGCGWVCKRCGKLTVIIEY